MPVDPGDLAARLARHQSLFGEVLAPVAAMRHPPVDPLRQWYDDCSSAGPADRQALAAQCLTADFRSLAAFRTAQQEERDNSRRRSDEARPNFRPASNADTGMPINPPVRPLPDVCCICQYPVRSGESIAVLECTHEMHQVCYDETFAHTVQDDVAFRCPICRRDALFLRTRVDTPTGSRLATPDPERSTHAFVVVDMQTPLIKHR